MSKKQTQRLGFPNVSIKLYADYDHFLENNYVEMAASFITMTLRDGLYGRNEGLVQVFDINNMHTRLTGDELISVKLGNANTVKNITRMYAIKHFSVAVDKKGDNTITFQIAPYHVVKDIKFGRTFFSNASETIETMLTSIHHDAPLIMPKVNGINVYVPRVPWTSTLQKYMSYVRDIGLSVQSETFAFVWEDFNGMNIMDYQTMIAQEPLNFIVGDPDLISQYADKLKYPIAFDFEWQTKSNSHSRNPMADSTVYSQSFLDQNVTRISSGDGNNSIMVLRSGGYSDMIYRNGYEEAVRLQTMMQYDGYAKTTIYGNFEITPGLRVQFFDSKNQFLYSFYVDEVIHEIADNVSYTHIYMFTNSKPLTTTTPIKVKNELKIESSD